VQTLTVEVDLDPVGLERDQVADAPDLGPHRDPGGLGGLVGTAVRKPAARACARRRGGAPAARGGSRRPGQSPGGPPRVAHVGGRHQRRRGSGSRESSSGRDGLREQGRGTLAHRTRRERCVGRHRRGGRRAPRRPRAARASAPLRQPGLLDALPRREQAAQVVYQQHLRATGHGSPATTNEPTPTESAASDPRSGRREGRPTGGSSPRATSHGPPGRRWHRRPRPASIPADTHRPDAAACPRRELLAP
jgi:hypothetical protein